MGVCMDVWVGGCWKGGVNEWVGVGWVGWMSGWME